MCHVLIIEDEPMIAMLLQDVFEDAGATSFTFAATEQDAVALALYRVPDVIASDVRLIEGNGPEAVRRIRAELGDVPVIFMTASPEACQPNLPLGVILNKPLSLNEITAAFRQFTSLAPAQA